MDKVKRFGKADVGALGEAEARRIWPEFAWPTGRTAFLSKCGQFDQRV
jgi:hypothetical protein